MADFSDYIIYVDESGDHGLANVDPNYPVFVLVFCIFRKEHYATIVEPELVALKIRHWGHNSVVLHEHEIRKPVGDFTFLLNPVKRTSFLADIDTWVRACEVTIIASVIKKLDLQRQYAYPANPYAVGLQFGLERCFSFLKDVRQEDRQTHVIVERRGAREDQELELEFRRICQRNLFNSQLPFEMVMASKRANLAGLQFADLIARPIGIKTLRPTAANHAYDIIATKFRRSPAGNANGWGLKVFP